MALSTIHIKSGHDYYWKTIDTVNNKKSNQITFFIDTEGVSTTWHHSGDGIYDISAVSIPNFISTFINDSFISLDQILDNARKNKYVETIFGRRRPIWDADSDNALKRKASERIAINMPIQGSAAELIKIAMIDIHEKIVNEKLKAKMILQIHDELLFEGPSEEMDILAKLVVSEMEGAMKLSIPLKVDWKIGKNWHEVH